MILATFLPFLSPIPVACGFCMADPDKDGIPEDVMGNPDAPGIPLAEVTAPLALLNGDGSLKWKLSSFLTMILETSIYLLNMSFDTETTAVSVFG